MSDTDLVKLYSGRILALAADIPHLGHLAAPEGSAKKRSPLCGSTIAVEVALRDGKVADFAQEVRACALGQASAAVLGEVVIGRTRAELEAARTALTAMLKEGGPAPTGPFAGYEVLIPARDYKNRHASILLALDATCEAVAAAEAATTAET
ncbi:iron-sulfur cluster assembly scaffold protein [bacterium]|nr:iron-sulfur cluster assembly scaffold protein [bacterium]